MSEELVDPRVGRAMPKLTRREKLAFLKALAEGHSHTKAAMLAGRRWRRTFERLAERDPEFKDAMRAAHEMGTDRLRDEVRRRAFEGVEEPVYQGGNLVGTKTVYSDRLLELELRRRDPAYRDGAQVEVKGPTVNVVVEDRSASLEDVARILHAAGAFQALDGGRAAVVEVAAARELLPPAEDG